MRLTKTLAGVSIAALAAAGMAALFAVPGLAQGAAPAGGDAAAPDCSAVQNLALENGRINAVAAQPAGAPLQIGNNTHEGLPAFCRVTATLTPSPDSNINVELWIPAGDAWNGRYLALGNG